MAVQLRTCTTDDDVEAVRQFLLRSCARLGYLHNWDPRRWEGLLHHRTPEEARATRERVTHEVAVAWRDDACVGAVIPEYPGGAHVQALPGDAEVVQELVEWAEAHLRQPLDGGGTWLEVWCMDDDLARRDLLHLRGYLETSEHERIRSLDLSAPIAERPVPDGYVVRSMRTDESEHAKLATLLNAAFGRTQHSAAEYSNFAAHSPSYDPSLQIVVEAADGMLVANAGFTAHGAESFVVVEPVCTHPDHGGRGLAQAAIAEGLRRARERGIRRAFIGAWHSNPVSNRAYEAVGFTAPRALRIWRREWPR